MTCVTNLLKRLVRARADRDACSLHFHLAGEYGSRREQDEAWDALNEAHLRVANARFAFKCATVFERYC